MMNIGEWVRKQCTDQGITISELARSIGCSQALIIHWRERSSIPKTWYFLKVCIKIAELRQEHPYQVIQEAAKILDIHLPKK
jgi:predicted transcriptional regulator